ncbi:MAG TPA: hypothetical protein VGB62_09785 [Allosphingosinicella sp.]|jgi:hypothetical protein
MKPVFRQGALEAPSGLAGTACASAGPGVRIALLCLFAALWAWLSLPLWSPVHVEGFSASLSALGLHMAEGRIGHFDALQPFNKEYFGLTKFGAVAAVASLVGSGLDPDMAMRVVGWCSLALLLIASGLLARRWAGASWWLVFPGLLLMPGIVESAFFYSDNVLAAALGTCGLLLLHARRIRIGLPAAGLLLGLSVLTRTDAVLAALAAPVILWIRFGWSRAGIAAVALTGVPALIAILVPLALFGVSILDVLAAGSAAVSLWNRSNGLAGQAVIGLYFLGLPGLALTAAGAFALVSERRFALAALLCGIPLLFAAILYGAIWEVRQLLGLTPFFAALAAAGLKLLLAPGRGRAALAALAAAATALALAGPVYGLRKQDGPRTVTGRLYVIPLWLGWQDSTRRDFAVLGAAAASAAPGTTRLLFTDGWNEDRYLHLTLLKQGYRISTDPLPQPCRAIAEPFVRGGTRLLHIRLHQSFVPYWRDIAGARLVRWGLPCAAQAGAVQPLLIATQARAEQLLGPQRMGRRLGASADDPRAGSVLGKLSYGPIVAVPLEGDWQAALREGYGRDSAAAAAAGRLGSPEAGAKATRRRVGFPR